MNFRYMQNDRKPNNHLCYKYKEQRDSKRIFEDDIDVGFLKTKAVLFFKIPKMNIEGQIRGGKTKEVRQMLMYILYYNSKLSLNQIGIAFSNRDHSTVIHAREKTQDRIDTERYFKKEFNEFIEFIGLEKIKTEVAA